MESDVTHKVAWAGVTGTMRLDDVLHQAGKSSRIAPLQVVAAPPVCGRDHIVSAAMHASRAIAQGTAEAQRPEIEFLRFLAGERQIKGALAKMGIDDPCHEAVVVALGDKAEDAVNHFIHGLGLVEDDSIIGGPDSLQAFGITAEQLAATTPEMQQYLVLEAVAAVDLPGKP